MAAFNGSGNYSWSSTGTLPVGFEFTQYDNWYYLEGMPTAPGNYSFTVKVTDLDTFETKERDYVFSIHAPSEVFMDWNAYLDGDINENYNDYLQVRGGTPPYTWNVTIPDDFPEELTFEGSDGDDTGYRYYLRGTPSKSGLFQIDYTVTDSEGVSVEDSCELTIWPDIHLYYDYAPGTVGVDYSQFLEVRGGNAPYEWYHNIEIPGLGFAESGDRYYLIGNPTTPGQYDLVIEVYDRDGLGLTLENLIVSIDAAPTPIDTPTEETPLSISWTFTNGTVDVPYYDFIKAEGGTGSGYTWTKTGDLPAGLNNKITGDKNQYLTLYNDDGPTTAGDYPFTIFLRDSDNNLVSRDFVITVHEPMTFEGTFDNGNLESSYNSSISVTGGNGEYSWAENTLEDLEIPDGLTTSFSGDTATINGRPHEIGTFEFTLKVSTTQPYYGNGSSSVTTTLSKLFIIEIVGEDEEVPTPTEPTSSGSASNATSRESAYADYDEEADGDTYAVEREKETSVVYYWGANDVADETTTITVLDPEEEEEDKREVEVDNKESEPEGDTYNINVEKEKTMPEKILDALTGGGGCDSGFGVFGLMALGVMMLSKRSS